jgi:hypothetical protein
MVSFADFDRYCEENEVQPGEYGMAFAQWLAEVRGGPPPRFERVQRQSRRTEL